MNKRKLRNGMRLSVIFAVHTIQLVRKAKALPNITDGCTNHMVKQRSHTRDNTPTPRNRTVLVGNIWSSNNDEDHHRTSCYWRLTSDVRALEQSHHSTNEKVVHVDCKMTLHRRLNHCVCHFWRRSDRKSLRDMTRILITNLEMNNVPIPEQVPPPRKWLRWYGLDVFGGHHVEGSVLVLHIKHLLNSLLGRRAATEQRGGCHVASIQ